ncbi:MAG: zinc ribbon domain-containing protein [Chloroflexota bacterium]|nr:zinc ribbon domain-containing protein [Chloroflexota bacterium]
MPTYDYACNECGHRFEKSQSFSDAPLKICPKCSAEALRKIYSPAGLVFKGAGWYKSQSHDSAKSSPESSCATGTCPLSSFGS